MNLLPTNILVGALLRRVNDSGGLAVVRAKGHAQAGAILTLIDDGDRVRVVERGIGPDGSCRLIDSTPTDDTESYWQRRRARDPDLWVIELAAPDAERFVVETIIGD